MDKTMPSAIATGDPPRAPTSLGPAASRATVFGAIVALAGIGTAAALAIGTPETRAEMRTVFIFGYLVAFVYYLSITLGAQFFVLVQHLCRAGWSVTLRRLAEAMMGNLGLMAVLFVPVALGMNDLYPWAREASAGHEPMSAGKAAYLSPAGFVLRCAACFAVWGFLAWFLRDRSIRQDADGDPRRTLAMQRIAGPGTIAFCIATTVAAFDLLMSLDPHWYSTVFGIHFFAGSVLSAVVVLTLLSLWIQRSGALGEEITEEHYHDLGKLMFAGVCFWGYIALCQYLLTWYSNLPDETRFLIPRQIGPWITVSALLVACHLLIPFFALLSRYAKRRRMLLAFCGVWLLAAHALDLFWLVMPNVFIDRIPEAVGAADGASLPSALAMLVPSHQSIYQVAAQHVSAIHLIGVPLQGRALAIVIGLVVGMGGAYWASTVWLLGKASLVPVGDPRLAESIAFENS